MNDITERNGKGRSRVRLNRSTEGEKQPDKKPPKLTEKNVFTLPGHKHKQRRYYDIGPGSVSSLYLMIYPPNKRGPGKRSFRVYYGTWLGKGIHDTLGTVGVITLDEARAAAMDKIKLARKGIDPKVGDPRRSLIFEQCVEDFTTHEAIGRKRLASADKSKLLVLRLCRKFLKRPIATSVGVETTAR